MIKSDLVVRNETKNSARITEAGIVAVEQMAANGLGVTSIAKALGLYRGTFADIRKRDPAVAEAVERGYSAMEDELVDGLMLRFRQGHLDPKDRGALTAGIFLLKTRRGYEGVKLPSHITINQDNRQQTIALPSAEDMETYMKRVANG